MFSGRSDGPALAAEDDGFVFLAAYLLASLRARGYPALFWGVPVPDVFSLKQIPEWVAWIAQDADGAWWGFSVEPNEAHAFWYENEVGRYVSLGKGEPNPDWRQSLRQLK